MKQNPFLHSLLFFFLVSVIVEAVWSQEVAPVPAENSEQLRATMALDVQGLRMEPKCAKEQWAEGMPKYEGKAFLGQMATDCELHLQNRPGNLVTLEETILKKIMGEAVEIHQAPQSSEQGTVIEVTRKFKFGKTELVARQLIAIQRIEDQSLQFTGETKEFVEGKAGGAKLIGNDWKIELKRSEGIGAGAFNASIMLAAKVEKPALAPQGMFMNRATGASSEAFQGFVESSLTDLDQGL